MSKETLVELSPSASTRQAFTVTLVETGEVILDASFNPEIEAVSILKARGFTGILKTRWAGSSAIAMSLSID